MLLSHRIIHDRNNKIQNAANCDLFYQDLQRFYYNDRIIGLYPFIHVFSYDLINYRGQIERNEGKYPWAVSDFREFLHRKFQQLRRINDNHSSYPDQHRVYEKILNQQWAYIFEPKVYLKPSDLRRPTPTRTRPSEFYKIFRAIAFPFLFERYCIENTNINSQFWEDGDEPPLRTSDFFDYYRRPSTRVIAKFLCLVFVANDESSPYISNIFLCERIVDRENNHNKSDFQKRMCRYGKTTSVVPIFGIEWDNVSFGFREN